MSCIHRSLYRGGRVDTVGPGLLLNHIESKSIQFLEYLFHGFWLMLSGHLVLTPSRWVLIFLPCIHYIISCGKGNLLREVFFRDKIFDFIIIVGGKRLKPCFIYTCCVFGDEWPVYNNILMMSFYYNISHKITLAAISLSGIFLIRR